MRIGDDGGEKRERIRIGAFGLDQQVPQPRPRWVQVVGDMGRHRHGADLPGRLAAERNRKIRVGGGIDGERADRAGFERFPQPSQKKMRSRPTSRVGRRPLSSNVAMEGCNAMSPPRRMRVGQGGKAMLDGKRMRTESIL